MLFEQARVVAASEAGTRAGTDEWSRRLQLGVKRLLDVVGALALLLALAPLLLLVMVVVRLSGSGPIFYRWKVMGRNGRPFTGYKFRTMVANADELKLNLYADNEMSGPVFKIRNDPRVTRVGRLLRRSSIDELPQLYSVLKGDMSLVGPRPPLQSEWDKFSPWHQQKLAVKPGITCLWQVQGRNRISNFDDWVQLDLDYIARWSLWLDVKILLLTIPAVLLGRGAS